MNLATDSGGVMVFEHLSFKNKIVVGCSTLLLLMAVVSSIVFVNVQSLLEATRWVDHTHDVIAHTNLLAKCMVDMETGQRGFMLTGNDDFLEPYHAGKQRFEIAIVESEELVSDNEIQIARFKEVLKLEELWYSSAGEYEINLKRKVDNGELPAEALKNILEGKTITGAEQSEDHLAGKDIMDNMRLVLDEIIGAEETLMAGRIKDNNGTASTAKGVLVFGTLFAILAGVIVIIILTRTLMGQLGAEPSVLNSVALAISHGDFSHTIDTVGGENLASYIARMSKSIESLITETQIKANILDAIPTPVLTVDTEMNVSIINGSGAAFVGKSSEECIGIDRDTLLGTVGIESGVAKCLHSGSVETTRTTLTNAGGVVVPVMSTAAPLKESSGTIVGAVEYMTDLSNIVDVQGEVRQSVQTLTSAVEQLDTMAREFGTRTTSIAESSTTVAASAEEMGVSMEMVSNEMNRVKDSLGNVSTSASEMNRSSSDIAFNADTARRTTMEAVDSIARIEHRVDELKNASDSISSVIVTIMEIADQTTLLALNATIEAARAGTAGRGFAVVADEVKSLAKETNRASEEVQQKIDLISGKTMHAIEEIRSINEVFENVKNIVGSIASAVEQQSATTGQMTSDINSTAESVDNINSNISDSATVANEIAKEIATVSLDIDDVHRNSSGLRSAANSLTDVSKNLNMEVERL